MSVENPLLEEVATATLDSSLNVLRCSQSFALLFDGCSIGQSFNDQVAQSLRRPWVEWVNLGAVEATYQNLFDLAKERGIVSFQGYTVSPSSMVYNHVTTASWDSENDLYHLRIVVFDDLGPTSDTSVLSADQCGEVRTNFGASYSVSEWESLRDALSDTTISESSARLGITRKTLEYRLKQWAQRISLSSPTELLRFLANAYCRISLRKGNAIGVSNEFVVLNAARYKAYPHHRLPPKEDSDV